MARGEAWAIEAFYRAWAPRVRALTRALTGRDEAFCDDVFHECMVRVARRIRVLPADEDLARWVARVAASAAYDALRRERRRRARERTAGALRVDRGAAAPDEAAQAAERVAWLGRALAEESAADRRLLVRRLLDGVTVEQAAREAGLTPGAAQGRLVRSLRRLRRELEDRARGEDRP